MDWSALAAAATALLATKFGESISGEAGKSAWNLVDRLRTRLSEKFTGEPRLVEAVQELESATDEARAEVERRIAETARVDPVFAAELSALIEDARRLSGATVLFAQARDNAKQINIGGDNHGPIRL